MAEAIVMKNHFIMMKKIGLITSAFLLFFTTGALGANYYVDRAGFDRPGCGDEGYGTGACASPQYLLNLYTPGRGDTIHINNGTYSTHSSNDGHWDEVVYMKYEPAGASGYLTFKARNDKLAIFDINNDGTGGLGYCVYTAGYDNIKFEGIKFNECGRSGARLDHSNNIYFLESEFSNIGRGFTDSGSCKAGSINFTGVTGAQSDTGAVSPILIDKSIFHDIGRDTSEACGSNVDHAIYATGHWKITNSLIYDNYNGYPIALKYNDGTAFIHNNTFSDINDTLNTTRSLHVPAFIFNKAAVAHIDNNLFIKSPSRNQVAVRPYYSDLSGWCAYNNVTDATNFWHTATGNKGNLRCDVNNDAGLNFSSQVTNAAAGDFTLLPTARDLIDQGRAANAPSDDYIGASRAQGSAVDIGAYEYVSKSFPSENPPQPPSGLKIVSP